MSRRPSPSVLWLALLPLALFWLILLLRQWWLPAHDTMGCLMLMHSFWSQVAHHGELGLWSPYAEWGKAFNLQIIGTTTPSLLLLTPLVKLFPHLNAATLFYVSFLLDELVLVIGAYALSARLYREASARLFVCLIFVGTSIWFVEEHFGFHFYYYLPLVFHFVWRGCETGRGRDLYLALLIFAVGATLGMALYLPIIQALALLAFAGGCFYATETSPLKLARQGFAWSREGLLLAGTTGALALPLYFLTASGLPATVSQGRQSDGGLPYYDFLNYGYDHSLQLFAGIFHGLENYRDTSVYMGVLAIPLVLVGLGFARSRRQIPFLVTGGLIFLVYLGQNSFLAPLLYYVPGFAFYRHLSHVTPLLKMVLIFLAGFGFDAVAQSLKLPDSSAHRQYRKRLFIWLAVSVGFVFLIFVSSWGRWAKTPRGLSIAIFYLAFLISTLLLLWQEKRWMAAVPGLWCLLTGIDVLNYRSALYHEGMVLVSEAEWKLFELRPMTYEPQRTRDYRENARFQLLHENAWNPRGRFADRLHVFYDLVDAFVNVDPCYSLFRADTASPAVAEIYRRLDLKYTSFADITEMQRRMDPLPERLLALTGCEREKVQRFDRVVVLPSEAEVLKRVTSESPPLSLFATSQADFSRYQAEARTLSAPVPDGSGAVGESESLPAQAMLKHFSAQRVEWEVETSRSPGQWFFYPDSAHPRWRATWNGAEIPILTASHAFKAVYLPAGKGRLSFTYRNGWERPVFFLLWGEVLVGFLALFLWTARVASPEP